MALLINQRIPLEKILNKIKDYFSKKNQMVVYGSVSSSNQVVPNDQQQQSLKFAVISLPYYFVTLAYAGSFTHNKSTHIQEVTGNGIYSIYFAVVGEDWFKVNDTSLARVVHDEVIMK